MNQFATVDLYDNTLYHRTDVICIQVKFVFGLANVKLYSSFPASIPAVT